ncbi:MAG: HAD family phosphatase [Lachnospiraceae bacterium]|nr:HAD family phosphatase [Lachnospiraceae bacterium]
MKIKNIVFDVGMVLIDFHWEKTMRELGISEDAIEHLRVNMMQHPMWNEMDRNVMNEDEIVKQFKKLSPQYADEIDLFLGNMEHVVTDFPRSGEWLKELKARGYGIYLLSNYPERMFKMHWEHYSFAPYVDGKLVSYECHYTKPEKEIYHLLCERYGIDAKESVFLDDRFENIEAAKEVGFYGILVHEQEQAIAELEQLLVKEGAYYYG